MLFLPIFVLLCCATVYIKAHYLIDAISGVFSGLLTYFVATRIYKMLFGKE
jgi:membrane-associated phospholipid phosphatase